jgi:hypothetical protein
MLGAMLLGQVQADQSSPVRYKADACDMAIDTLICRPLGLAATTVGTAIWLVSLPFSLAGENEKEVRKKLVYEPAAYTFKRPLGSPECSCSKL